MVLKWILRKLIINNPKRYGISSLDSLASKLIDYKTKWHNVFCFREFLRENLSGKMFEKLIDDANEYFVTHSGYFDKVFAVGGSISQFEKYNRACFDDPKGKTSWNLSGKKLCDYLTGLAYQPGFDLYKEEFINILNNTDNVKFKLDEGYEFPIVTYLNWR